MSDKPRRKFSVIKWRVDVTNGANVLVYPRLRNPSYYSNSCVVIVSSRTPVGRDGLCQRRVTASVCLRLVECFCSRQVEDNKKEPEKYVYE